MHELIATLWHEQQGALENSKNSILRDIAFPKAEGIIKVIVGMRRAGKTYYVYQLITKLLAQGVSMEQILYINFEDDRLLPLTHKAMGALVDDFYTLFPANHDRLCYLFFDEIQNVENWPQVIRRLHDKKNAEIILTGSSAKLLSKEIATNLRGRSIEVPVWPYHFYEFLLAHKITEQAKPYGRKQLDIMQSHMQNYIKTGGFPGMQALGLSERHTMLQTYVDAVVLRDIVQRYKINNPSLIKYLLSTLLKNFATPFSVNKFFNDIKSQGYKVGKDTIYQYINYIEDAYLMFPVSSFKESLRSSQISLKKFYAVDPALIEANNWSISDKLGSLLENIVYLDLRRRGDKVQYYQTKDGYEVDFITKPITGKPELIQVCWDTTDKQALACEQRALTCAQEELGLSGKIITLDDYLREGIGYLT